MYMDFLFFITQVQMYLFSFVSGSQMKKAIAPVLSKFLLSFTWLMLLL